MELTLNKRSALAVTRRIRASHRPALLGRRTTAIQGPDPFPRKRWTPSALDLADFAGWLPRDAKSQLDVVTDDQVRRPRSSFVSPTVYKHGLPRNSFVDLGGGLAISCPELLFCEMATLLDLPELVLLGFELCGRYTLDPDDPDVRPATFKVDPVTNPLRISSFLDRANRLDGLEKARCATGLIARNSWSPMESIVSMMAMLPCCDLGYGLGRVVLNPSERADSTLGPLVEKSLRIPDIMFEGTSVGINYDGSGHLDARQYADDRRRDRDLWMRGDTVLVATSADLYERGALDRLMGQCAIAIQRTSGRDMSYPLTALQNPTLARMRQRLVWSLLPRAVEGAGQ